jgi:hypothetical protein
MTVGFTPGKPRRTRDRDLPLEELIVRFNLAVRNWPVGSNAVPRIHLEVRWMEARRERCPVHRASADSLAGVVVAERQRVFSAGDSEVVPIELVRTGLIRYPVALGIPERTCLETYDREARPGETLEQYSTRRAYPDEGEVDLVGVRETAPRDLYSLHGTEAFYIRRVIGLIEFSAQWSVIEDAQCVPPCPGWV